mgnify:CR=1 FL=1
MILSFRRLTFRLPLRCLLRLKRRMRWVRAAGCIVCDEAGHLLLIRRNGRWDLPKGKVEPGETLLQAALREAREETGIRVDCRPQDGGAASCAHPAQAPFPLVAKTYHIYNLYGGWHLKQTSWFAGRCTGVKPAGSPQREEGITAVEWVRPDEWHRRMRRSYGTMKNISRRWKNWNR